jgi:YggT family protein
MRFITIIQILIVLLDVLWWVIIAQVALSWLIAFNVLNTSNDGLRRFLQALDRFLDPLYRPIRKILPDFGGLDFSPLVLILIISILGQIVLPNIAMSLPPAGGA